MPEGVTKVGNDNISIEFDFSKLVDFGQDGIKAMDRTIELVAGDVIKNINREASTFKRPTGRLTSGIFGPVKIALTEWGIEIRDKYWKYVEGGRGPVYPIRAKALHFFIEGKEIFVKSVGPAQANPFVSRAIQTSMGRTQNLLDVAIKEIFG